MLRHFAFRIGILASAVVGISLAAPATARAKQIRQDQAVTGLAVLLDQQSVDFTFEAKGAPGRASGRALLKLAPPAPPSPECSDSLEGFPSFVLVSSQAVVGGSLGEIFANFSKLLALFDSGVVCQYFDPDIPATRFSVHGDGTYVGGVGFEGGTGTFSFDLVGVGLTAGFPGAASASGSLVGTIVIE